VLAATGPFHGYPLEDTFAVIAEAGFDGVELMVTTERATQRPDVPRQLAAAHGVEIRALHGPFLLLTRRVFGNDPRTKVIRSVSLAEALGARVVVTHAPYQWSLPYIDWLPDEIERVRSERGITVTVENMFPVNVGRRRLPFHTGIDLPSLRRYHHITLDTSHLAAARLDLSEAWRAVGDRVAHVHASNNAGTGRDSHLPLDDGVLDVLPFLEELTASGYGGDVTLEINFRQLLADRGRLVAAMTAQVQLARHHLALGGRRAEPTRA
jgi:sugar phosphate isomerase/epimerase